MIRECAAAFIVRQNKILLGKRSATRRFYPGVWDVFGGHRKAGETLEEALRRELSEELGIVVTQGRFLLTAEEPNAEKYGEIRYHIYLVTEWSGEPENLQPKEHEIVRWFDFDEALKLPFAHSLYAETIKQIQIEEP